MSNMKYVEGILTPGWGLLFIRCATNHFLNSLNEIFKVVFCMRACVCVCMQASVGAKHRPHACHSYKGIPFGV